jgi:hypothetical protein
MVGKRVLVRAVFVATVLMAASVSALAGDPGIPIPFESPAAQISDQQRGFMLIYNIYTSSPASPTTQNTRFSITNTFDSFGVAVHLFFVDGVTCSISDRYICLSQNQTSTFLASDQDPGTTGYLVAVATGETGFPIPFDFLIGDAFVKFQNGFFGNLAAEAVPANLVVGAFSDAEGTLGALAIAGFPRVLAVDNINSRADGNETLLIVNGTGGNFTTSTTQVGNLFGILYDDAEQSHSWARSGGCQLFIQLNNDFPRTTPRFDVVIPAGQTGWMKFWSTSTNDNRIVGGNASDGRTLLGAVFQRNPQAGSASGAFQGARNLHKLRVLSENTGPVGPAGLTGSSGTGSFRAGVSSISQQLFPPVTVYIFPVFPANCGFVGQRDQ